MSDRLRIAYLTSVFGRPSDTFIRNEVDQLRGLGLQVQTFSVRRPDGDSVGDAALEEHRRNTEYLLEAGLARIVLKAAAVLFKRPRRVAKAAALAWRCRQPGLRSALRHVIYLLEALYLADRLHANRIQHLHNHIAENSATVAMLAAEAAGIPFSMTVHGPGIFYRPETWSLGLKINRAAFTVCITNFCLSQCMVFAPASAWRRMHVVYCSVGEKFIERPAENSGGEGRLRAVCVGRLCPEKGQVLLLNALRAAADQGADLQLDLVGDGPSRAEVEQAIDELGLGESVRVLGWRSPEEVRDAIHQADLFLLPSFAEGLPIVLMEALALERPVITTAIAGIPELVENGRNGRLVSAGSVDELIAAIIEMTSLSPEARAEMGAEGRRRVLENHHPRRQAEELLKLFASAIGGG